VLPSLFFQALSDEGRAAVGLEGWVWRSNLPIEELDRLFNVFRSFKWDFKGGAFSDKVAK
jgi:hypothetical protein